MLYLLWGCQYIVNVYTTLKEGEFCQAVWSIKVAKINKAGLKSGDCGCDMGMGYRKQGKQFY